MSHHEEEENGRQFIQINLGRCFCIDAENNKIHAIGCSGIAGNLGKSKIGVLDGYCEKISIGSDTGAIVANNCNVDVDGMRLEGVSTITYTGMRKGCPR